MVAHAQTNSTTASDLSVPASDEELFARYRNRGDWDAFETLVHRYERPIYSYLVRYLHNAQLAEEVFQATFLRLHKKSHLYSEGRPLRPWLYRIATSCAIDTLRREGRHHAVSLDESQTDSAGEAASLISLLESRGPGPPAPAA